MKLLPFHRFTIRSPLPPTEALDALRERLEPRKFFRWRVGSGPWRFEGDIERNAFTMTRVMGYRNSFVPVVTGQVSAERRGAVIAIAMRMHAVVLVFMAVWMAGATLGLLGTIAATLNGAEPAIVLIPIALLAVGYGMVQLGFWYEASNQEDTLRRIFRETA